MVSNKLEELDGAQALASKGQSSRQRPGRFDPSSDPAPNPWQECNTMPYLVRVFDKKELAATASCMLDLWFNLRMKDEAFQQELPFPLMLNQR